jgi:hypothetical protein
VTVTFVVDPNGAVTGFVARSNGSERMLRRVE